MIISVPAFASRKQNERQRARDGGIDANIQSVRGFSDFKMLCVKQDDPHPFRQFADNKCFGINSGIQRFLYSSPGGDVAHSPALPESSHRRAVEQVTVQPSPVFFVVLFYWTKSVSALLAMNASRTVFVGM